MPVFHQLENLGIHFPHPFIHPIFFAYLGLGHRSSSLSKEAQTSLSAVTSSSSRGYQGSLSPLMTIPISQK